MQVLISCYSTILISLTYPMLRTRLNPCVGKIQENLKDFEDGLEDTSLLSEVVGILKTGSPFLSKFSTI